MTEQHDELTVPERQLKPPTPPKPISISAVMGGRVKCDKHNNPMAAGVMTNCVTNRGTSGMAMVGEVKLTFIGCTCTYWRPLK